MTKAPRIDFTLEFKKEAVRLVQGGQRQSEVSASLGISGQTLHNWVNAETAGRLTERAVVKARAVQRSLLKVIEKMDFRPPKAAARRSCGIVSV